MPKRNRSSSPLTSMWIDKAQQLCRPPPVDVRFDKASRRFVPVEAVICYAVPVNSGVATPISEISVFETLSDLVEYEGDMMPEYLPVNDKENEREHGYHVNIRLSVNSGDTVDKFKVVVIDREGDDSQGSTEHQQRIVGSEFARTVLGLLADVGEEGIATIV